MAKRNVNHQQKIKMKSKLYSLQLQGYDNKRERQHVQYLLRRVQDGQGRLQHAWSMERLRLRRIIEISTCEKDSQQVDFFIFFYFFI